MKTATIRTAIMVALVLILVSLVGCGILEKISTDNLKGDKPSTQNADNKDNKAANEDQTLSNIDAAVPGESAAGDKNTKQEVKAEETTEIVLYFASEDGQKLVAEKRDVPKVTGIARETLEELIKGPKGTKLKRTVPEGTKLMDIDVNNGLATVSFSKDLHEKHMGGSNGEQMTLYSIVNTLTQFPTVEKVQFLIEGQAVETLAGHADITKPLSRNSKLIKE